MKAVNDMLRDYRTSHGIKQTFIEKKIGIPPGTLSALENGRVRITADMLVKICVVGFGVTPQIFLPINSPKSRKAIQSNPFSKELPKL